MTTVRIDALSRLGAPTVECSGCWAKIFESQAIYLRRLWLDPDGEKRSTRIMRFACSHECAVKVEAESREAKHDSSVWIDDSHLVR
jgi:hypothetical protein